MKKSYLIPTAIAIAMLTVITATTVLAPSVDTIMDGPQAPLQDRGGECLAKFTSTQLIQGYDGYCRSVESPQMSLTQYVQSFITHVASTVTPRVRDADETPVATNPAPTQIVTTVPTQETTPTPEITPAATTPAPTQPTEPSAQPTDEPKCRDGQPNINSQGKENCSKRPDTNSGQATVVVHPNQP